MVNDSFLGTVHTAFIQLYLCKKKYFNFYPSFCLHLIKWLSIMEGQIVVDYCGGSQLNVMFVCFV